MEVAPLTAPRTTNPTTADPRIRIHSFDPRTTDQAPPELADIWPRMHAILSDVLQFNHSEARVRGQQLRIALGGGLVMPSPFSPEDDPAHGSYYSDYRFAFAFGGAGTGHEPYLWITDRIGTGYAIGTIVFPDRHVAVSLYPLQIHPTEIDRLNQFRIAIPKQPDATPNLPHATAVVGSFHLMHTLWNELPALDHVASAGLPRDLTIAAMHQPCGPLRELYPELASRIFTVTQEQLPALNRASRFLIGFGSRTVTRQTRERLLRVANHLAPPAALTARDQFQRERRPIFWLSVKPPKRTVENQSDALTEIITALLARYPRAGIILNGVSHPWDWQTNPGYSEPFRQRMHDAASWDQQTAQAVVQKLGPGASASIHVLSDISVMEEISWGSIADFYFCHGGSMQHKIGWVHGTPGMIHSNARFIDWNRALPSPAEGCPEACYLPRDMIVDDAASNYTEDELARCDQNYRFAATSAVAAELIEAFEQTRADAGTGLAQQDETATPSAANAESAPEPGPPPPSPPAPPQPPAEVPNPAADGFWTLPAHTGTPYAQVLQHFHRTLRPKTYIEIGTDVGVTLKLAECASIAVDPKFRIEQDVMSGKPACHLMQMASDQFFLEHDPIRLLGREIDLAFLDGLHLFEFLLRDFANTERYCKRNSVILLHDCLPTDAYMVRRDQRPTPWRAFSPHPLSWTGDVWKALPILEEYRPDLRILALNAQPTGLIAITSLDPASTVLHEQYFDIVERYSTKALPPTAFNQHVASLDIADTSVLDSFESMAELFWL